MNNQKGMKINLDMKKFEKNEVNVQQNLKNNDYSDYLNCHKMFIELNVKYKLFLENS